MATRLAGAREGPDIPRQFCERSIPQQREHRSICCCSHQCCTMPEHGGVRLGPEIHDFASRTLVSHTTCADRDLEIRYLKISVGTSCMGKQQGWPTPAKYDEIHNLTEEGGGAKAHARPFRRNDMPLVAWGPLTAGIRRGRACALAPPPSSEHVFLSLYLARVRQTCYLLSARPRHPLICRYLN